MTMDMPISAYEWWYGRDEPPLEPRLLRAGPVTATLVGRDLRNVRYGGVRGPDAPLSEELVSAVVSFVTSLGK